MYVHSSVIFYGFHQFYFPHYGLGTSVSSKFHEIRLAADEGESWQTEKYDAGSCHSSQHFQTHL